MTNPRILFVTTALALGIGALPSAALADGPYVGLSGGLSLPEDSSNSGEITSDIAATDDFDAIAAGTPLGWNTEFDEGFQISGQLGYAFDNGLRVEFEGNYTEYGVDTHTGLTVGAGNIDALDVAVLTRGPADAANPTVGTVIADGQGDVTSFGLFGNIFYDIQTGSGFKPYVGAGVGLQSVDVEYVPSGVDIADESDEIISYQLMAGASFEVTPSIELFGQYTYRDGFEEAEVDLNLLPATLGIETAQSVVSAGVRVKL